MFDTEFGFKGMLNFQTDTPFSRGKLRLLGFDDMPGTYAMGYKWLLDNSPHEFYVTAVMNRGTQILEGVEFLWLTDEESTVGVDMTPQDFLKNLGVPSQMLTAFSLGESAELGGLDLSMIYDQGVVFDLYPTIPIADSRKAEFCLGNPAKARTRVLGVIYIVGPLAGQADHLSEFQQYVEENINRGIKNRHLVPFEKVFGITPEYARQLALKGGDNCLEF